jgi:hypothetical protein
MKLSSAIALFSCLTSSAAAARLGLSKASNLVDKAVPVTLDGKVDERRLNDQISVTIYDSIAFHSCLTLTTSLDNKVMETLQADSTLYNYWKQGQIATTQSYVLFSICKTGNCTSVSDSSLLMVDLESYMGLTQYRPAKTIDYCNACENAKDWCLYGQYQNSSSANGGRDLAGQVTEQPVSCTTCSTMGCFDASNNNKVDDGGHVNIENVVAWVEALTACEATGSQWYNMDVYAQFMCNSQGTGVEIGIFLDNECTVYTALESYAGLFPNSPYLTYSTSIVTYPFINDVNCAADIEWVSPENWDSSMATAIDDQYAAEANQYCQQLLQSKMLLPLDNCAANGYGNNANGGNDDGMFSGYTYDLAEQDINDAYAVCTAIYNVTHNPAGKNIKQNVQNKNVFNSSNTLYTYSKSQKSHKAGRAVGITFLVLAVLGALGFVGWKALNAKKDSKKQPLVEGTGALA